MNVEHILVAKGRDDTTNIYGVIVRPTNYNPAKKYPVIEYIYAGPHSAFTPKSFAAYHSPQSMAELGFIVVQMDGKPHRSLYIRSPLQDLLRPVHPHYVVHPSVANHLQLRRVPQIVMGLRGF